MQLSQFLAPSVVLSSVEFAAFGGLGFVCAVGRYLLSSAQSTELVPVKSLKESSRIDRSRKFRPENKWYLTARFVISLCEEGQICAVASQRAERVLTDHITFPNASVMYIRSVTLLSAKNASVY
jgi:hypothetical protein